MNNAPRRGTRMVRVTPRPDPRILNFNDVGALSKEAFYQEIKNSYRQMYRQNITNQQIRNMNNPELFLGGRNGLLGRPLEARELEWLGRQGVMSPPRKPRQMSPGALKRMRDKYGSPSPQRPAKRVESNGPMFISSNFLPTTNSKIQNKVFLLTDINNTNKVRYVYDKKSLIALNQKVSPFTQIKFNSEHIKPYENKNKILNRMKNLREKSWNREFFREKVLDDFAKNKIRAYHDAFFYIFPTKAVLTAYMGFPKNFNWPLENMKSLGQFTLKDIKYMKKLKEIIDTETRRDFKNLYQNRLSLLISNKYGYTRTSFKTFLRAFPHDLKKIPRNVLNLLTNI